MPPLEFVSRAVRRRVRQTHPLPAELAYYLSLKERVLEQPVPPFGFVGTDDWNLRAEGERICWERGLQPRWTNNSGIRALARHPENCRFAVVDPIWWKRRWLPFVRRHLDPARQAHIEVQPFNEAQMARTIGARRFGIAVTESARLAHTASEAIASLGLGVHFGPFPDCRLLDRVGQIDLVYVEGDWWERVWLPWVRANPRRVLDALRGVEPPTGGSPPRRPRRGSARKAEACYAGVEVRRFSDADMAAKDLPWAAMIVTASAARRQAGHTRLTQAGFWDIRPVTPEEMVSPAIGPSLCEVNTVLVEGDWWERVWLPAARRTLELQPYRQIEVLRFSADAMALPDQPEPKPDTWFPPRIATRLPGSARASPF